MEGRRALRGLEGEILEMERREDRERSGAAAMLSFDRGMDGVVIFEASVVYAQIRIPIHPLLHFSAPPRLFFVVILFLKY